MEKILGFFGSNAALLWPLGIFLIGWLLPTPKFKKLGEKAGESLPPKLRKLIAERIDAFEKGLLQEQVEGDCNLIDNSQLSQSVKDLKVDLGLKE